MNAWESNTDNETHPNVEADKVVGEKYHGLVKFAVSVALFSEDVEFAEKLFLELSHHCDAEVRGSALLGFGHLARRFKKLSEKSEVLSAIAYGLQGESLHLKAQARSVALDLKEYLGWELGEALGARKEPENDFRVV